MASAYLESIQNYYSYKSDHIIVLLFKLTEW